MRMKTKIMIAQPELSLSGYWLLAIGYKFQTPPSLSLGSPAPLPQPGAYEAHPLHDVPEDPKLVGASPPASCPGLSRIVPLYFLRPRFKAQQPSMCKLEPASCNDAFDQIRANSTKFDFIFKPPPFWPLPASRPISTHF